MNNLRGQSWCICGKPGNGCCPRCFNQKYCSEKCASEHLRDHIKICPLDSRILFVENEHDCSVFQIIDGTFGDPAMALAVSSAKVAPKVTINHLDDDYINYMIGNIKPAILQYSNQRIVCIIDLISFPFVRIKIDNRDQTKVFDAEDNSHFAEDVKKLWKTYKVGEEVPVITVNTDIDFVGLQLWSLRFTQV